MCVTGTSAGCTAGRRVDRHTYGTYEQRRQRFTLRYVGRRGRLSSREAKNSSSREIGMNGIHSKSLRRILTVAVGVALFAGAARVEAAWTLTLVNETGHTLTFFDVNLSPPPSRLPAGTTSDNGTFNINPDGFNPVLAWPGGISTTGMNPNGFLIGLALTGSPPRIQYKRFHYKVTPGEAGTVPALQPILLDQQVVDVVEGEVLITVDTQFRATIGAPPASIGACCTMSGCTDVFDASECSGGTLMLGSTCTPTLCAAASIGACCALSGCADVFDASECSGGNLLLGDSCTPTLCTSASDNIGPGGGTIESPDGSVSVEFPPGCLSANTMITIEEGDYPSRMYDIELTGTPAADFDVHVAYSFEPSTLDFCPEAQLCMSFDRTALGLDPTDCGELRFFHRDKICGLDGDADCVTDLDCPPGIACNDAFHTDIATCDCPAATSVGQCCANIGHFSDYILVSPAKQRPPRPWCCRRFCISACGRGIVPCLSMMFVVLGLAKVRRAGRARSLPESLP